jgi:hypothetical protein
MKKPVWETPNPSRIPAREKKSTPLTPKQKSGAKAMAMGAGRPYPNLVDNMRASMKAATKKGK